MDSEQIKISDAARAYAKKAIEHLGAYHVDEAGRLPLNSIAAQNYLYDAFKETLDATRAEARREAIGMIEQNYSRQGAIESIRALATQPAPEPSEPMRSAEEWCNSLLLGRDNSEGCARPETEMRQQMPWGSWVNLIRAIQTNAASAAEPLLEDMIETVKFYADDQNFIFMKEYGLLEYGDRNIELQGTERIGKKARDVLSKRVKA